MSDAAFTAPVELKKAQRLANLLDTAITLPVVRIKLGLDFLVGLIPGAGDAVMFLVALRLVWLGTKLGMPKGLLVSMVRNALIDFALGFIPVIGDIADLFFKANQKNVRIMEKWWISNHKDKVDAATQARLSEWQASLESESQ
ncbi:DUF4112 domain-containing protein [Alteromonas sp. CYL-A6]|uniref:DUF4112 domain-containing protein n=1 Tax=Alteromonas nitratireducens TaxID=3390813 RepID=UPI0034B1C17F